MTEPMTSERLAEIEACENATRFGPWTLRDALEGDGFPGNLWVVATGEDAEDDSNDVVVSVGDRAVGAFIETARTAVPELLAEVKRLNAHLAEYVGWEPTVREEYEHACGQLQLVEEIVRRFSAGRMLELDAFVASLKHALEMP